MGRVMFWALFFLVLSVYCENKLSTFYVTGEATVFDESTKCDVNSPCPLFCPFQLDDFKNSLDVRIIVNEGFYNLTKMNPFKYQDEVVFLYMAKLETNEQKISMVVEGNVVLHSFNLADAEEICNGGIVGLFFIAAEQSLNVRLEGIDIRDFDFEFSPKIPYCDIQSFIFFDSNVDTDSMKMSGKNDVNVQSGKDSIISGHSFELVNISVVKGNNIFSVTYYSKIIVQNSSFSGLSGTLSVSYCQDSDFCLIHIANSTFSNCINRDDWREDNVVLVGAVSGKSIFSKECGCLVVEILSSHFESIQGYILLSLHSEGSVNLTISESVFNDIDIVERQGSWTGSLFNVEVFRRTNIVILDSTFENFFGLVWAVDVHFNTLKSQQILFRNTNFTGCEMGPVPGNLISIQSVIAVVVEYFDSFIFLENSHFSENTGYISIVSMNFVDIGRGDYAADFDSIRIRKCFFRNNDVILSDLYARFSNGRGTFVDVWDIGASVFVEDSRFHRSSGSALVAENCFLLVVKKCEFVGNQQGGVSFLGATEYYESSSWYSLVVVDSIFHENEGTFGGAVRISGTNCYSAGRGFSSPYCGIYGSTFIGNKGKYGGAIYATGMEWLGMGYEVDNDGYSFCLFNSTFEANFADFGGAIYLEKRMLTCFCDYVVHPEFALLRKKKNETFSTNQEPVEVPLTRGNIYFTRNVAKSGGAIYVAERRDFFDNGSLSTSNCSFGLDRIHKFTFFEENILGISSTSFSDIISDYNSPPSGLRKSHGRMNYCKEYLGRNYWECVMGEYDIIDYFGHSICSPTLDEHLLYVDVKESGGIQSITMSSKEREISKDPRKITFFAKYGRFKKNDVSAQVIFLDKPYDTKLILKYRFPPIIELKYFLISLGIMSGIVILLCLCCCHYVSCLCCLLLSCSCFRLSKSTRLKDLAESEFYEYPEISDSELLFENSADERSSLLNVIHPIGRYHVFVGSKNGKGSVFYVERGNMITGHRYYPVFDGSFQAGKKKGEGTEFFYKSSIFVTDPRGWEEFSAGVRFFRKFSGTYRDNLRDGFGTEYKQDENSKRLMGNWVAGSLTRIFTVDYPLDEFDIQRDIVVGGRIGEGGFSSVYCATYRQTQEVAIKRFGVLQSRIGDENRSKSSLNFDEEENSHPRLRRVSSPIFQRAESFERSQKIGGILKRLKMFNHPNLVSIIAWTGPKFVESEFAYIMELCACSVRDYCKRKGMSNIPIELKDKILLDCAHGTECLHDLCGFVHRDLKLGNLLMNSTDPISMTVKVCDFNLGLENFSEKEMYETAAGSPFNCAPESFIKTIVDRKCDVFSFGIMMFELYFNKIDDPFDIIMTGRCPECGEKIDVSNLGPEMKKHHVKHKGFTPLLFEKNRKKKREETEGESDEDDEEETQHERFEKGNVVGKMFHADDWRIKLIQRCWDTVPQNRPQFSEIVNIFRNEGKK